MKVFQETVEGTEANGTVYSFSNWNKVIRATRGLRVPKVLEPDHFDRLSLQRKVWKMNDFSINVIFPFLSKTSRCIELKLQFHLFIKRYAKYDPTEAALTRITGEAFSRNESIRGLSLRLTERIPHRTYRPVSLQRASKVRARSPQGWHESRIPFILGHDARTAFSRIDRMINRPSRRTNGSAVKMKIVRDNFRSKVFLPNK